MRRLLALGLAGVLALAISAPVAAGANVSNSSGSATVAEAFWYADSIDGYSFGYLSAWQETGSSTASLNYWTESGAWVDCTPGDPNDDFYGFQGSYSSGYGMGDLSVGKGYGSASASGTIDLYGALIDDCAGTYEENFDTGIPVSLVMTATGPKIMYRGTGSFHVPSQFNSHSSYSSTTREAAGTVTIGSNDPIATAGAIGKVSWRDHYNG